MLTKLLECFENLLLCQNAMWESIMPGARYHGCRQFRTDPLQFHFLKMSTWKFPLQHQEAAKGHEEKWNTGTCHLLHKTMNMWPNKTTKPWIRFSFAHKKNVLASPVLRQPDLLLLIRREEENKTKFIFHACQQKKVDTTSGIPVKGFSRRTVANNFMMFTYKNQHRSNKSLGKVMCG